VTLAETQALFHALATGEEIGAAEAERLVLSTPELPAAERIGIYAGMYASRLVDALRADFPKLAALLGEERFRVLGEAYARAHPSAAPDIGRFGRHLAGYLRAYPARGRPDLSDLAALEWARSEAFFEAPAGPAGREDLAALGAERFAAARLRLVPALRLVRLEHGVVPLWRALEDGAPPPPPVPGASAAAVWRRGFDVLHAAIGPEEALALEAALRGEALGEICGAFAGREDAAEAAFAALGSWLDEGWVARVD